MQTIVSVKVDGVYWMVCDAIECTEGSLCDAEGRNVVLEARLWFWRKVLTEKSAKEEINEVGLR